MHITEETLAFLHDDYEVEDGNGGERNSFLRENNIKTYLIKDETSRIKVMVEIMTENNIKTYLIKDETSRIKVTAENGKTPRCEESKTMKNVCCGLN